MHCTVSVFYFWFFLQIFFGFEIGTISCVEVNMVNIFTALYKQFLPGILSLAHHCDTTVAVTYAVPKDSHTDSSYPTEKSFFSTLLCPAVPLCNRFVPF